MYSFLGSPEGVFVRAVIQRVRHARVTVDGNVTGEIGPGLLVLLGVEADDTDRDGAWLAAKIANLRIFADDAGKMNDSLIDISGGLPKRKTTEFCRCSAAGTR